MSKSLDQRMHDAVQTLIYVDTALSRHPGRLPAEVESTFRSIVDYRNNIVQWKDLFDARVASWQLIEGLETQADANDNVPLDTNRVKFQHARFLGVQSYITTTWALADRITSLVGLIFCTPESGLNSMNPAQLVSHFINRDKTRKTTAAALFDSLRQTFGWPIGLSYAVRNHFVHDGAKTGKNDFFVGPARTTAFRISNDGWTRIEGQAKSYNIDPSYYRPGTLWPADPKDDLRELLKTCEREMDDGLGVLLGSACNSLHDHIGYLLGED